MVFQYDYFDETRSFGKDTIGWMVLQTDLAVGQRQGRQGDRRDVRQLRRTRPRPTPRRRSTRRSSAQLGNIALIVTLVVGAAFVTILMIVGNTMVLTVRERTREIGVLKTLGFSGRRILRLVLGESVLLALLGGIPGPRCSPRWSPSGCASSLANFVPGFAMTPGIARDRGSC